MLQVTCIYYTKPIVAIYSDGAPDYRVTYGSVQLSLVLQGDFDMIVAVRTPPPPVITEKPCGAYNVSSKGIPVCRLNAS